MHKLMKQKQKRDKPVKCQSNQASVVDVVHKVQDSNIDVEVPSWHDSMSWRCQRMSDLEQCGHCVTSCAETHQPIFLIAVAIIMSQQILIKWPLITCGIF